MHKVLVVEDEELIRTMIKINLQKAGYQVRCCKDGECMISALDDEYFDLVLLDIMLPGMSGEECLKWIRTEKKQLPVIMVTAKNGMETRCNALDCGADDYIAKPFNMRELLARIGSLIRRSQGERMVPSDRLMKIGEFQVDIEKRCATSSEGQLTLSEKEIKLLTLFHAHSGKTLQRVDILDEVWGMDVDPTPRTIDNFIVKFRRLFETNPEKPKHFLTVRAKGYRFIN